jgi:putative mycofactocin binding protein MftB
MHTLDAGWRLDPQVALRPEPFGALAYHFGTRRLSFLKSRALLEVVQRLAEHRTAREACVAVGVSGDAELARFETALRTLADSGMICPREA